MAVRLGGSFAIAPRQLAVHGGVFYENRGVEPAYVNIDNFALARVGFGLGFMWRVRDFDLTAAYGHIFQETVRIAPPEHQDARLYDTAWAGPSTPAVTASAGWCSKIPTRRHPATRTRSHACNRPRYSTRRPA